MGMSWSFWCKVSLYFARSYQYKVVHILILDDSSGSDERQFKVIKKAYPDDSQSANETQSEDESLKVEPFNFVLIKECKSINLTKYSVDC